MKNNLRILLLNFLLFVSTSSQTHANPNRTISSVLNRIDALELSPLRLGYVENLQAIKASNNVQKQKQVFESILTQIDTINSPNLPQERQLDIDLIRYEATLNLERISLEEKWNSLNEKHLSENGLASTTMGKIWYQYFLKRWVDKTTTPEEIMSFGQTEVDRVHEKLKIAQKRVINSLKLEHSNLNGKWFYLNSRQAVHDAFIAKKNRIRGLASACFPYIDKIPNVDIKAGTNQRLAQTPGYYSNNRFSYNYFDKPFNIRQITWLYLHEAIPGHHYQLSLASKIPKTEAQEHFNYSSYREGWAAYVEELGNLCGFYDHAYDELGKWEWDMIRSVRIVLDVGLNYYAWADAEALQYWQKYINDKDDIALREIARMRRWPAQVITYKYGANALLKLKENNNIDSKEGLKAHHTKLLTLGPMPFSLLEKYFGNNL